MTPIESAWAIYAAGSLGCCIAAWWMFLWAWRFIRYSAVVTVMTIVCTPYAIDPQTMTMAPAIYTLVFEALTQGVDSVKPLIKLMVGIWLIAIILVAVFVLLTRRSRHHHADHRYSGPSAAVRNSSARNSNVKTRSDTRYPKKASRSFENDNRTSRAKPRDLNNEERQARDELFKSDIPIRAIRD